MSVLCFIRRYLRRAVCDYYCLCYFMLDNLVGVFVESSDVQKTILARLEVSRCFASSVFMSGKSPLAHICVGAQPSSLYLLPLLVHVKPP